MRLTVTDRHTRETAERACALPATLGRDAASVAIALEDRNISRRHARLELVDGLVVITDLGSANGTFVNDERVQRRALRPGDVLRIGRYELAWTFIDDETTSRFLPDDLTFVPPSRPRQVAARRVVEAAEAHNRRAGHELAGFLSVAHGFAPAEPPLRAFPASHRAWDDLVDQLPELFRRLAVRRAFDALPVLDARPEALPDRYLNRASTLLGVFAHAYQYMAIEPPAKLPDALWQPWSTVSRRLGKQVPSVSYTDLFLYNWRLLDPAGPRRLDNLELLVPTWRNAAERIFYLVTTEFAMGLTPVLDAMVRAQEGAVADDREAVEAALLDILDALHHVTQAIYPQIDPNPRGRTAMDQVLWAKTVGTAGVPIVDGAPTPSGTAQPQIHAIDAFLERREYGSLVGQQSTYLAGFFPRHWQEFVAALREVSVRQYVEDTRSPSLRGIYNAVLDAYVGDRGWMGLHRIKAYGFLEVAFKVGRQVTTGARFTGLFKDRTWDQVDAELATVREERLPTVGPPVVFGTARPGPVVTDPETGAWTCYAELDVTGQGVHHQPGDRVGVLAENDDDIVARTVAALQATGDELVGLSPRWRAAVAQRYGFTAETDVLPLRTVLRFARLRPVDRDVAKRLLARSGAGALRRVVDARMEDQWELWDVLNLLHAGGYDVTRLWRGAPTDPESLCAVVAPETPRLYSIASAPPPGEPATALRLVVGGLSYASARTPWSYARDRSGTASHFLRRVTTQPRHRGTRLSLRIVATPRFRLPADPARPVVMLAAGSGVAPFHGFVAARARLAAPGETLLYLGVRTPAAFHPHADLDAATAAGRLELNVAFSRADATTRFDGTRHVVAAGSRRRVDDLLREDAHAQRLWDLLRPVEQGGRGGFVYLCGSAPFAASMLDALTDVARRGTGSAAEAREFVRRLSAEGRLSQDVFTTYLGHAQQGRTYEVSELATRNAPDRGFWMAVSGRVYDVTEFLHLHIGGPHIVRNHCGLDATAAYRKVLHHLQSEVDAQLGVYEIGHLRRLAFGGRWGVVLTDAGLASMALQDLFTAWVRTVYLIVGMENALAADYGFVATTATWGEDPRELTPFKAQFVVEAHRRFLVSYLDGLVGDDLRELWLRTVGFCDAHVDVRTFDEVVAALGEGPDHRLVRGSVTRVRDLVATAAERQRREAFCRVYARADADVLRAVKEALLTGVRAFEEHEADVVERAGPALLAAVRATLEAVGDHDRMLAAFTRDHGIVDAGRGSADGAVVADRGLPGHGGPLHPAPAP